MAARSAVTALRVAASALAAVLWAAPAAAQVDADPLTGIWQGTAATGGFQLHLVLHVDAAADGGYRARIDLLDECFAGLEVTDVERRQRDVAFAVPFLGGRFTGALRGAPPDRLDGEWLPGAGRVPLTFRKVTAPVLPARPQHPSGEPPYREVDVEVPAGDGAQAVVLAGTLTLPAASGPHPGVVLLAGSGYQTRDGTIRGHHVLWVLADHLTRAGIAVLRLDKRGCGRSGGELATATSPQLADDAAAAVRWLGARDELDRDRIGLVGHSEGGMLAPMVATGADGDRVRCFVALAGPCVRGADALIAQSAQMARADGLSGADCARIEQAYRTFFERLREDDAERRRAGLERAARAAWDDLSPDAHARLGDAVDNFVARALRLDTPWVRHVADLDPGVALARMRCPALLLFAERDVHVDAAANAAAARAALGDHPAADTVVRTIAGCNHLFQPCATCRADEYFDLELTIAPAVLDEITHWLRERFR
ncbi:MAG: alpha/beta fold hydrolase [Planctomycetota bacterium]